MSTEDLTQEEAEIYKGLVNPDVEDNQNIYKFDEELQRYILGMLLCDKTFLIQSFDLVKPEYFQNESHKTICKCLFTHFKDYQSIPNKVIFRQILKDTLDGRDAKTLVYYLTELETVLNYYVAGVEERSYLLNKITNFAKMQALKIAFSKALDEIKKKPEADETWGKINTLLKEAMSVDRNFEIGLDYFEDPEERYRRAEEAARTGEQFTTGFAAIDNAINGGLLRGEIGSWVAMSGVGKSLQLTTAAVENLKKGKRVLYVSLEIDQDRTAQRFDTQITHIPISKLNDRKEEVFETLNEYVKDQEDKQLLIIKQFPGGQFDVNTLRAYYTQLILNGFKPDLVIIDYIGEMKDIPGIPTYESRYRLVRDLRGWAVEEDVCVLTAMQTAEATAKEQLKLGGEIDEAALGDSKGQMRPLDACWSINRTKLEEECNLARIFVMKHRFGKSKFKFCVKFDSDILKYIQIKQEDYDKVYRSYQNSKKEKIDTTIDLDGDGLKNLGKKLSANFENNIGDDEDDG